MLGLRHALGVEGREQFAEAVLEQKVLGRQLAILEADLVQVLAAHRVVGCGDRKAGRALLDQDAADALAAGLAVDAGEDDEILRLLGPADQRLDAVQSQPVADPVEIGPVIGDIGAGLRLGHADRQQAVATRHRRQDAPFDDSGRIGGNHPGLHPDLAEDCHRRRVADLGDLFEDEGGVKDGQAKPAIFLRHSHAEHPELGEPAQVLPGKGAVHPAWRTLAEFALGQVAHGRDKTALLLGEA